MSEFDFPGASKGYRLADGVGVQVFAVLSSEAPMSSSAWNKHIRMIPWNPDSWEKDEVWTFIDGDLQPPKRRQEVGVVEEVYPPPKTLSAIIQTLQKNQSIKLLYACAFSVRGKEQALAPTGQN